MFKQMEISEQVYKGRTPSKTPIRADANRDGHIRKCKGGESASSTIPKKVCAGKHKTKIQAVQFIHRPVIKRHACCIAPDTTLRIVNCLRFILKSMPHSGLIKKKKPDPVANLTMVNPPDLTKIHSKSMSWKTIMILSLKKVNHKMPLCITLDDSLRNKV